MKRFALLFILLGMTALLVGCDWFSTATLPTSTDSTTTTSTSGTESEVTTTTTPVETTTTTSGETTTTTTVLRYTVTFYDEDGTTVLGTDSVLPNGTATPPANPTKASTAQYDYAFAGWSAPYSNVTGNLAVHATYTQTVRNYTVTFFDEDGTTLLGTSTVPYGSDAVPPATPTKPSTTQYDYAFSGWSAAITNVTGPLAVHATYSATVRNYTVTFYDEDGTTSLGTSTVAYGSDAVPPATTPAKPSTAEFDYAFAGWSAAITNVTGNFAVNATYTPTVRNYTVTFYDEDGTTSLGTSTVPYGSDAVPPADPTKPSTAEFDFAFAGWSAAITNVTGTFAVNATFASTLRSYTVTFFDADGTTLGTSVVEYGGCATAPADPFRAGYSFHGWDADFSLVHGNLSVHATYDYTILRELVAATFDYVPEEWEIDERILIIKAILGTTADEETANWLGSAFSLKNSFTFETQTDFLAWYAGTKTAGFTREQLLTFAVNAIRLTVNEKAGSYDPSWLESEIAYYHGQLTDYESQMAALLAAGHQYCAIGVSSPLGGQCNAYLNQAINTFHLNQSFAESLNQAAKDGNWFNSYTWGEISYNLDWYFYYSMESVDPTQAMYYQTQYQAILSTMSSENQALYQGFITPYLDIKAAQFQLSQMEAGLAGLVDLLGNDIGTYLEDNFILPYQNLYWNCNYVRMMEHDYQNQLQDYQKEHQIMVLFQAALNDPDTLTKVRTLLGTVYDILDSTLLGLSPETFDLVVGLATGTISPESLLASPESIAGLTAQAADLLRLLASTVDQADVDNLTALLDQAIGVYLENSGMDPIQQAFYQLALTNAVDHYLEGITLTYWEIIDLLEGMTPEKIQILLTNVQLLQSTMGGGGGEISTLGGSVDSEPKDPMAMVIPAATIIDLLLYDRTFDFVGIAGYVVDGYYDFNFMFQYPDDVARAEAKALFLEKLNLLIDTAHEITLMDPSVMDADDLKNVYTMIYGVQWLPQVIQSGFDQMPPFPSYDHQMFVELLASMFKLDMDSDKVDVIIGKIAEAFGETEEDTYYEILAAMNHLMKAQSISTPEEFAAWAAGLEAIGYTDERIAGLAEALLLGYIDTRADWGFADEILNEQDYLSYLESQLASQNDLLVLAQAGLIPWEDVETYWDAYVRSEIARLPVESDRTALLALWEGLLLENHRFIDLRTAQDAFYVQINAQDKWYLDYTIGDLQNYSEQIFYWNSPVGGNDTEMVAYYQDLFDSIYNYLSSEDQALVDPVLTAGSALYQQRWFVVPALWQDVNNLDLEALYTALGYYPGTMIGNASGTVMDAYWDYLEAQNQIENLQFQISWAEDEIVWANDRIAQLGVNALRFAAYQAYFEDPDHVALLHNAIGVLVDEVDNLLMNLDPAVVDFVFGLIQGTVDPSLWTADDIETLAQMAAGVLALPGSTIGELEQIALVELIQDVVAIEINLRGDLDETQKAALIALFQAQIPLTFEGLFDVRDALVLFLNNLTSEEVTVVMTNVQIISELGDLEDDLSNNIRAVAMANIILAVAGDGNLDYATLVGVALVNYLTYTYDGTYVIPDDVDLLIDEVTYLLDDILLQADVIDGYDPYYLQAGEAEQINAFHLLIEALMVYADQEFRPQPIV